MDYPVDILYVTSDRPGAGKTTVVSALALELSQAGRGAGYFKPFSAEPGNDADVAFIGHRTSLFKVEGVPPAPLPMPEQAGDQLPEGTGREVRGMAESLAADVLLAEGPSLAYPGVEASGISAGLAELLDARVLAIFHYSPHLTADRVIGACEPFRQRLLGVVVNSVTRYKMRGVASEMAAVVESGGVRFLGAIPEDRLMLSATLGQIAQLLGARWVLGKDKSDDLVENFLIGGNIMDQGATYFGRTENKAVVVRGDRPDIQLAALSTPTTCLILTGGREPIEYVHYQAEQQGVPVLVVQSDTMATAHALDATLGVSNFHHPAKQSRFHQLMREHADLPALLDWAQRSRLP